MRKGLLSILMAGVGMLMASCELEMSDNGKLDGFWQLRRLGTLRRFLACSLILIIKATRCTSAIPICQTARWMM